MKILLTGAGGFLGKKIAHSLLSNGQLDLRLHFRQKPPTGFMEMLRASFPTANIEAAFANLLNASQIETLTANVDCVIHSAAGMRGAAADMFANSVIGTRNLLETAGSQGIKRVVLISSFSVYQTAYLKTGALVTETTGLEPDGPEKGSYGYAKTRQETLFRSIQAKYGFESVILRPGVIYGPESGSLSPRVGIRALGIFFSFGGRAILPLTYVENCADAVAQATISAKANSVFNVVDDNLPTCGQYLKQYQARMPRMRSLPVPYWFLLIASKMLVRYHSNSKGQLPAVLTPYIVRSMYQRFQYSNDALKSIGWSPVVSTAKALDISFEQWGKSV